MNKTIILLVMVFSFFLIGIAQASPPWDESVNLAWDGPTTLENSDGTTVPVTDLTAIRINWTEFDGDEVHTKDCPVSDPTDGTGTCTIVVTKTGPYSADLHIWAIAIRNYNGKDYFSGPSNFVDKFIQKLLPTPPKNLRIVQ